MWGPNRLLQPPTLRCEMALRRIRFQNISSGRLRFGSVRFVSQKVSVRRFAVQRFRIFPTVSVRRFVPCQEISSGSAVSVQAVQGCACRVGSGGSGLHVPCRFRRFGRAAWDSVLARRGGRLRASARSTAKLRQTSDGETYG